MNSVSIDSNHPRLPPGDWGLCGAAHLQSLPPRQGKNTRSWWSSGLIWKGLLCSFVSLLWLGPCTCYTNNQYIQYILATTLYTLQSGSAQSSCCCIRSQQWFQLIWPRQGRQAGFYWEGQFRCKENVVCCCISAPAPADINTDIQGSPPPFLPPSDHHELLIWLQTGTIQTIIALEVTVLCPDISLLLS